MRRGSGRRRRDATASGSRMRSPCVGRTLVAGSLSPASRRGRRRCWSGCSCGRGATAKRPTVADAGRRGTRRESGVDAAFVDGVAVRALLAAGRVFEAGPASAACGPARGGVGATRWRVPIAHTAALRVRPQLATWRGPRIVRPGPAGRAAGARAVASGTGARRVARRASPGRPSRDADAHLAVLARVRAAAPALLRRVIDRRLAGRERVRSSLSSPTPPAPPLMAASLIRLAHEHDDDATAVRRVLERVTQEIQASRVDLQSCRCRPCYDAAGRGLRARDTSWLARPGRRDRDRSRDARRRTRAWGADAPGNAAARRRRGALAARPSACRVRK